MFRIPLKVIQNSSTKKSTVKQNNNTIFNDKIVNRLTQPTLFNVQSAASNLESKFSNADIRGRRKDPVQKDLTILTNETLMQMNITLDPLQKDFSLLGQNSLVLPDPNPNILDKKLVDNIENSPANVKDYFSSENDPILQLDEGNNSAVEYSAIERAGSLTPPVDLSKILSDINVVNQNGNIFGKNKYFM
jgi:hypothetical protein